MNHRQRPSASAGITVALPLLLSAAFVLQRFADQNAAISDLWRPLFVAVSGSAIILALLWAATRRLALAAILTSIGFTALVVYVAPAVLLIGLLVWWLLMTAARRLRRQPGFPLHEIPVRIAAAFGLGLFLVGAGSSVVAMWPRLHAEAGLAIAPSTLTTDTPSIVLIIVDGYPRDDSLQDVAQFDNEPFLRSLQSMSFEVARNARSNYNKTWLTVETLLDARYASEISELANPPSDETAQTRLLHEAIDSAAIPDFFESRRYEVVTIPSQVTTTDLLDADVRSTGHLSSFELGLLSSSIVARLFPGPTVDVLTQDMRAAVSDGLRLTSRAVSEGNRPRLVITHLLSPHPPFILGQSADYLKPCFPRCGVWTTLAAETEMSPAEYASRLRTQIEELNSLLLATVTAIANSSPSAFIIIMSDHGIRRDLDNVDEHFRTFFAARTPGYDALFPDDIAPVNVFRRILSGVFGEELEDLPYRSWLSDWDRPLILAPWP